MSPSQATDTDVTVQVTNLGGIDETTVQLRSGVNVLSGRNATNRTSFLRAVMGALGSDRVSLKADADAGSVRLDVGDDTYTRRLERHNGAIRTDGSPYLTDPTLADLFAFLLESNEARLAVSRSEDLRDLLMRPIDVEDIRDEIDDAKREKQRLDSRIDELDSLRDKLPTLEAEKQRLASRITETHERLDEKRNELEAMDGTVEASREEQQQLDAALSELKSVQSEIEDTRFQRETEAESVETLGEELSELKAELDSLPDAPTGRQSNLEERLESLREQRTNCESTASQLQSVIQFNEDMLSGTNTEITAALRADEDEAPHSDTTETASNPTNQLLSDSDTVVCWTCGTHVETDQIESTVARLKELRSEKLRERSALGDEIESATAERKELANAQQRKTTLSRRVERTEQELEERTERVSELDTQHETLREQAADLEARIETLEAESETQREDTILDQHTEINQLEFDLEQLETEHEDVCDRIEEIESKQSERADVKAERESVDSHLTELRTRIERIESEAVEAFNEHMDAVLGILAYDNLERIWIERTKQTVREGRKRVERSFFTLHIVRSTDDGTTYEDTIDHLSESEREVTGLVFALAGYLVHEVYETVPFMILDSLEAIDSDRIAALVDYLADYVETIVVALLPEDAAALDDTYHRVTEI